MVDRVGEGAERVCRHLSGQDVEVTGDQILHACHAQAAGNQERDARHHEDQLQSPGQATDGCGEQTNAPTFHGSRPNGC